MGQRKVLDLIEVRWPSGIHQKLRDVATNQVLLIEEPKVSQ
jgi:hypothetical protein